MKMPSSISKLLENKYVLYIVFFLAVTNVFGYMVMGNYKAIALFILVGYLVHCFNKNMIIVLLTPLVLTSIFMAGGIMKEGAQNMKAEDKTTPKEPVKNNADSNNVKPTAAPKDKKKPVEKKEENINETEDQVGTEEEPTGDIQDAASGMTTMYKKRNRIDYASTVEDAYGDLNKILGGDGIKRLTEDTQKLMGQQMQLAEAMKSMTPLLSQAKSLMAGFDMKQFGDITAMAKQFGATK
jgi:hypothetical protein